MHDLAYSNYRPSSGVLHLLDVEQVRRILVQSHCGLALSTEEGAMYASGEYLLAGLPVVTTALGGALEIVDESCGLLVPPGDTGKLQEGLRRLIGEPACQCATCLRSVRTRSDASTPRRSTGRCIG